MSEEQVRAECKGQSNEALVETLVILMAGFVRQQGEIKDLSEAYKIRGETIEELRKMLEEERGDHIKTLREHGKYLEDLYHGRL